MSRQFDVCRVAAQNGQGSGGLAIVLQHDSLSELSTRIVAPLVALGPRYRVNRSTPVIELDGDRYIVAGHLLATIPRRSLGAPLANLQQEEPTLKNALDSVFFGI